MNVIDDPRLLWFLARGTGVVSLVLLTVSVVLGITTTLRVGSTAWPRFLTQGLHRTVSLVVVGVVAAHVAVLVLDDFVTIRLVEAFVPFIGEYRPLWSGLGALSADLLLLLVVTSLLRWRLPPALWRGVHWAAYACWPLAVLHGLGTGYDPRNSWFVALTAACVLLVVAALAWRLVDGWPAHRGRRLAAVAAAVVVLVAGVAWTWQGPLRPGWSSRAGPAGPP